MIRATLCQSLVVILATAWISAWPQQRPVFRATSHEVVVDVGVFEGQRAVKELTAADFVVEDDGAPQAVHLLSAADVGMDISLLFDTSGSVTDPKQLWNDLRNIGTLLRPVDRVRLVVFDSTVREVLPLTETPIAWPEVSARGGLGTKVLDALSMTLVQSGEPGRRRIVVQFTDGVDVNASYLLPDQVRAIANRSDALVYLVLGTFRRLNVPNPMAWPKSEAILSEVATLTGGRVLRSGDVSRAFREILTSLQQAYVLVYQVEGVPHGGWHTISVQVKRPGNYVVRARRGYFAS